MGVAAGIGFWLLAQALAFGLAGAGHGWGGASALSVPLAILYPLACVRTRSSRRVARAMAATPAPLWGWFGLWIAWQIVIFVPALCHKAGRMADGGARR